MACSASNAIPVVMLLLLMSTCDCQKQIFIVSSDSSHCPEEVKASQCYNLTTLVSEGHLSIAPNTTLLFLPGEHFLQQNLDVKNTEEFQMIPYYTANGSSSENSVKITCTGLKSYGGHSVIIQNVPFVEIKSISFLSCGVAVHSYGALQLRSVSHSEITNCKWYESRSSAIFIKDSNTIVADCQLMKGSCSYCSGGGIHAENSNVTITGSNAITNNTVLRHGGGLSLKSSTVHVDGNLTVNGNSASSTGGGMYVKNSTFTTTSTSVLLFANNKAHSSGGGLFVLDSQCISTGYLKFFSNTANLGGGILTTYSRCIFNGYTEFSGNYAVYNGGGILVRDNSHCTFNKYVEFSVNSAAYNGGGMFVLDNSYCTFYGRVEFSGNNASIGAGGGMSVDSNSNCTFNEHIEFSGNSAYDGGGILVRDNSHCTFNKYVEFSVNSAAYNGGGMFVLDNSYCTFYGRVEFSGNNASIGAGGGMSVDSNSNCTFNEHIEFSGNSAYDGGGMLVLSDSHCVFNGPVEFTGNKAIKRNGGGMLVRGDSHCIFNQNVTFFGNNAITGGGIAVDNSNCTFIDHVEFYGNSADTGGGISVRDDSHCTFKGRVDFSDNNATSRSGGGMSVTNDSHCTFNELVEFSGNNATYNGGGMSITDDSHCTFKQQVEFSGNNAAYFGGGILVHNNSYCTFYESIEFSGNRAAVYGGGMSVYSNSFCAFNGHVEFSGNSAVYGGGGISVLNDSHCVFDGPVEFTGNNASGGGMSVSGNSQCTFKQHVEFSGNIAAYNGGGILVHDNSYCAFHKSTKFTGNEAMIYGGGMSVYSNSICIFNGYVQFFGNSAAYDGGGISVGGNSHCTFNGSVGFSDNSAIHNSGGGMSVTEGSSCTFNKNVEVFGNDAETGGGMAVNNSNCTFHDHIEFSGNSASYTGGGMSVSGDSHCIFNEHVAFSGNWANIGGGIAVYDSQCTFNERVEFSGNNATNYGGGLVATKNTNCSFSRYAEFSANNAVFGGGLLVHQLSHCIFKNNSTAIFAANSAWKSGGSLYAGQESSITFLSLVNISTSTAGWEGGGIVAREDSLLVMSGETTLTDNHASAYGGAISLDVSELRIDGNSQITNNSALYGGAIQIESSEVHMLSGDHYFKDNSAQYGGGWSLFGGTSIRIPYFNIENTADSEVPFLFTSLNVHFISNHAEQYGGAIWVDNSPYYSCTNKEVDTTCFLRGELNNDLAWQSDPPNVTAFNNTAAIAGSNLYGGNIDSCSYYEIEPLLVRNFLDAPINSVSSDPYRVCLCSYNKPDYSISDHYTEIFSGEQLQLVLVGVGQRNGTVPAVFLSNTDPPGSSDDGSMTQSAPASCKLFSYTITSEKESVKLMLYPESLCPKSSLQMLTVTIKIKPCPPGFMLHHQTKSCTCSDTLTKLDNNIQCDIDSQSFSHQHGVWIGYDQPNDIIYHPHCPFDYCKQELTTFTLNSTDDQCRYNRSGLICGACVKGYSLTLGGSQCTECSHMYLMLFVPLALAGVVLVIFLLTLKLTVSVGTINGLIFFANISGTNSSIFLPPESTVALRVFIAWLNLDLGIDTCLFDGLDMYIKVWLQFIFPFYVFVLIAIIIFVSHRSTLVTKLLGSDPVAVLATLILLAYTKLLRTVLTVMSFTYIQGFDGSSVAVWLYDGNVRYLSGKHIPLFIFALLIMLFLIVPYTVILLFGPYLQRHSKNRVLFWINDYRIKPFLHSYYAPLKDKYRSWIGLLLALRLFLLIVFVSNSLGDPSINLFAIATAVFFLLSWRVLCGTFYTNWCLDALEIFFIVKLGLFSISALFVLHTNGNQRALTDTLVGVAFIVFIAITVYHVWRKLTDSRWWRHTLKPKWQKYFNTNLKKEEVSQVQEDGELCTPQTQPKVTTTVIELREPVLEFT